MRNLIAGLLVTGLLFISAPGIIQAYIATFTVQSQSVKQSGNVKILDKSGNLVTTATFTPWSPYSTISFARWSTATNGQYFGFQKISSAGGVYYSMVPVNTAPVAASGGGGSLDMSQLSPRFANMSAGIKRNQDNINNVPASNWAYGTRSLTSGVDLNPSTMWNYTGGKARYLDATVSSRASQASVNSIPTNPLLAADARLINLDVPVSSVGNGAGATFAITTGIIAAIRKHPEIFVITPVLPNQTSGVFTRRPVVNSGTTTVTRGDSKVLVFYLGTQWNLSGKTVYAAARANYLPATAYRFNKQCTVTDAVNGVCTVTLTSSETGTVGTFLGEVTVFPGANGLDKETAQTFTLVIKDTVRK